MTKHVFTIIILISFIYCEDIDKIYYNTHSDSTMIENTSTINKVTRITGGYLIGIGGALLLSNQFRECGINCESDADNHLENINKYNRELNFSNKVGYTILIFGVFLIYLGS